MYKASALYRALGDVYGLPKMHYKGKQGDFYIMVSTTHCVVCQLIRTKMCHHVDCVFVLSDNRKDKRYAGRHCLEKLDISSLGARPFEKGEPVRQGHSVMPALCV